MGSYVRGDVLLAPVRISRAGERKVRPVVVVTTGKKGELFIAPVSSKPPSGSLSLPLRLEDFAYGGLELFGESYLLISQVCRITTSDVVGKMGRLQPGVLEGITGT